MSSVIATPSSASSKADPTVTRCYRAAIPDAPRPIFALNLFDLADREEYLAYARRSAQEVERHGGKVVALGNYVWHLFDRLEDLRPLLKSTEALREDDPGGK